jgi:hypothetical protein
MLSRRVSLPSGPVVVSLAASDAEVRTGIARLERWLAGCLGASPQGSSRWSRSGTARAPAAALLDRDLASVRSSDAAASSRCLGGRARAPRGVLEHPPRARREIVRRAHARRKSRPRAEEPPLAAAPRSVRSGGAGDAVRRHLATMEHRVEHHLARAAAAGGRAPGHCARRRDAGGDGRDPGSPLPGAADRGHGAPTSCFRARARISRR